MRRIVVTYALGVVCASLAGFLCPWYYLGFIPLAAGLIWAAVELVDDGEEVPSGNTPTAPRRI